MLRIKIGARGTTYWPLQLQLDGWTGEMDIRTCGMLAVIAKPNTSQAQIIKSLELMLEHEKLNAKTTTQKGPQQK